MVLAKLDQYAPEQVAVFPVVALQFYYGTAQAADIAAMDRSSYYVQHIDEDVLDASAEVFWRFAHFSYSSNSVDVRMTITTGQHEIERR
jgi:hypothetical protein